jgi:hypothetical protein
MDDQRFELGHHLGEDLGWDAVDPPRAAHPPIHAANVIGQDDARLIG